MNRALSDRQLAIEKTTAQSVCAVMVTYHPSERTLDNVSRVLAQVRGMVVVDNGSDDGEIAQLRLASEAMGYELIANRENVGIAEALNQGVRRAKTLGYGWVILFDQDSTVSDGFVERMFAAWESHSDRERIASIHPRYVDRDSGTEPLIRRAKDGGPVTSMTSGALMPVWIFDKIGGFASEYFIDCVDHEYCFRIRAAGYFIVDSREAILLHSPGDPRRISFAGLRFRPTHHNAVRRYYISRNRLALYRKYFLAFPTWVLQYMYDATRETAKCFLGERDRARKVRSFLLGTWDGLTGRMGAREDL